MNFFNLFAVLTLISVAVNIVSYLFIIDYLNKHGVKINIIKLKLMLPYINQYKEMTEEENGSPGRPYKYCTVTFMLTLLFAASMIGTQLL